MDYIRHVAHKNTKLTITYRDNADTSVIDEFFVDKLYRSLDTIIPHLKNPILDVGAHIGVFSLYAKSLNRESTIIALEPHPENTKLFQKNISQNNFSHIELLPYALGVTDDKKIQLYLSKDSHNHSTSLNHVDENKNKSIKVPSITLEKIMELHNIQHIGLLKMDIEGGEFDILQSLANTVFSAIEYIAIEYHENQKHKRDELEKYIRPHGFSIEHFPNPFDKRFGLLFARNKRIKNHSI